MSSMFSRCTSLEVLDLSSFVISKVEEIYYMFYYCESLKTIYVSNRWSASHIESGLSSSMFTNCVSLPNFDSRYVTRGRAHYNENGYLTLKG